MRVRVKKTDCKRRSGPVPGTVALSVRKASVSWVLLITDGPSSCAAAATPSDQQKFHQTPLRCPRFMPVSFRVPHDLRYIAKALFSPTECDLWEIHWKKLLKPLLRKYDLAEVVGEGDEAMEALAGEGEFSSPEDQILLAQELLQDIAAAGKEALLKIPDATRVPASGKLAAKREEGPRDDTKWPFSASQPPDHQGGQVAARPSPAVQRSHEDGLRLFRRTGTLNQGNRQVLRSSVTISLQDEDLTRIPAGFLGPLHDCRDTTVLILEDSFNTPNEITILPEGKSVQMRLMADTGADVTIIPQTFVAQILSPVHRLFPEAIILHYMDDVLVCASDSTYLKATLDKTIKAIKAAGLQIAEEKIQFSAPWRYLGFLITGRTVTPQTLTINEDPKTLRDLQQLCGTIAWIRPLLGLTTEELSPLFCLLRGDGDLASPRELTPAAREALQRVAVALKSRQAHRVVRTLPVNFAVLDAEDDCRLEDTSETSDAPDRHHLAVTGQALDSPTAERKHMGHAGEVREAGQLLYGHGKCGQSVIHVPGRSPPVAKRLSICRKKT
ncbi:uncharacterized protein LOC128817017 [Vidua macroura]|uniref:uncharacterized protein LOC128817017 n=2 Tax=Vidua macroura TaxID=187451 RepID=UPI0023A8857C|nr:uncharacterized protein LOC128817017 [Vidua macroura]